MIFGYLFLLEQCNGTGSGPLPSDPVVASFLSFLKGYDMCSLNRQIDCPSHRLLQRMNIVYVDSFLCEGNIW
jgi:hypothetical protein